MDLYCSICLYIHKGVAPKADTIMNGQAVCYDHMGHVAGGKHGDALIIAREEQARE